MQYLLIISMFICMIIFYNIKKKDIEQKYIQHKKEELDKEIVKKTEEKERQYAECSAELRKVQAALVKVQYSFEETSEKYRELAKEMQVYQREEIEKIRQHVAEVEAEALKSAGEKVKHEIESRQRIAAAEFEKFTQDIEKNKQELNNEIANLQNSLQEHKAKQDALNEEISRRRQIEEQNDFYRVCLSEEDSYDIKLLQQVKQNLKKSEIIDKIIYDNYVAKPVLEMIKRVLQNTTCSGIYKITCLKTGEIYIGKSSDIKNRWQQHCKTAFNCGTIASSLLHKKMRQYGIENFTFELLEKVPKEQLTEREKYYINFYQTKEVGLNERNG